MRECLGMEFLEKEDLKIQEEKKVVEENFDLIKKELKDSIKKTYNLEVGEIMGRVEIINELFHEFEDTLKDLEGETLGILKFV